MAGKVSVHIDSALLDAYFMDPVGDLAREIQRRGNRVHQAIQANAPRHTGRLAATVRKRPLFFSRNKHDQVSMTIDTGSPGLTPYLGYILDGTEPHEIRPRGTSRLVQVEEGPSIPGHRTKRKRVQRRALRFAAGGGIVFATVVHHPGTSPNDFITRGLQEGFAG